MKIIITSFKTSSSNYRNIKERSLIFNLYLSIPRGLTARIAGFHPAGPGSTPGVGMKILLFLSISYNERYWNITLLIIKIHRIFIQFIKK